MWYNVNLLRNGTGKDIRMKMEMNETIYCRQDTDGTIETRVRRVLSSAAKFAEMENTAFWEDRPGDCIAVREGADAPETASAIPCKDIGKALEAWAREIFDLCMGTPDETGIGENSVVDSESGEWSAFAHRRISIVISDLPLAGGLRVEAFAADGVKESGIAFVPSKDIQDTCSDASTMDKAGARRTRGNSAMHRGRTAR